MITFIICFNTVQMESSSNVQLYGRGLGCTSGSTKDLKSSTYQKEVMLLKWGVKISSVMFTS